jgi:hypothetical protein
MNRILLYFSLAGGVLLTLSALAHSTGWSAQFAGAVTEAGLAPDLVAGLQVGWYFGSFCMAGFGLVASFLAWRGIRGQQVDRVSASIIGGTLVIFGLWAMFFRDFNPFFFVFILPGMFIAGMALVQREPA